MKIIPIVPPTVESIQSETDLSLPPTETEEQTQLAIDEAMWLSRRDYYQSSQVA